MDQARLEKYAGWLVQNKDKKGSPEFEKVSTAYKSLRSGASEAPKSYNLSDVPAAAIKNAPSDAATAATGLIEGITSGVKQAYKDVTEQPLISLTTKDPTVIPGPGAKEIYEGVKSEGGRLYDNYGSYDKVKRSVAERPISTALDIGGYAVPIAKGATIAAKGAGSVARGLKSMNKLKTDYPDAAGAVARDLDNLQKNGGYDLADVTSSNQGAKGAVAKSHTDNKVLIDEHYNTLKDQLDPQKATDAADFAKRVEAGKAFASGDHQVMDHATPSQIEAVATLVGHTKQGAEMVHTLKKQVEISRLRDQVHGGLSKHTDELSPISVTGGRFGVKGIPQILASAGGAYATGGLSLGAQAGAVVVGRGVDMLTGRRSLPKLFTKQNAKNAAPVVDESLPDVLAQNRAIKAIKELEAKLEQSTHKKEALAKQVEKAKTTQAKQTYNEALSEDRYRARAKKALESLAKKNAPKEPKAPKQDFGISPIAVKAVNKMMTKKALETKELKDAVTKGAKAETKDKVKVIRDPENYAKGVARVKAQQHSVSQAISRTKTPNLKSVLSNALDDLQKPDATGPKNHKRRVEIYEEALAKAKSPHEKAVIKDSLRKLAFTFSGKK